MPPVNLLRPKPQNRTHSKRQNPSWLLEAAVKEEEEEEGEGEEEGARPCDGPRCGAPRGCDSSSSPPPPP
jgi:hypothetical protein